MYADAEFYKNDYKGTAIPDEELDSFLSSAADKVDQETFFRIKDFTLLTPFQQKQVRKAVCAQADHAYEFVDVPDWIGSYSVGSVSVSKSGDSSESSSNSLAPKARGYLMSTNLMYRGL